MSDTIVVALIGFAGTMAGSIIGIMASQSLTQYRLKQLEDKVEAHNNLVERTYKLEGQVTECQNMIEDLKAYHKPA